LIPRYFRTVFDGGVTELYYLLKNQKESFHNTSITLDCDQCTVVTQYGKPTYTRVRKLSSDIRPLKSCRNPNRSVARKLGLGRNLRQRGIDSK